jgi:hypothetical protein
VYADARGHAILSAGSFRTTYQSPLRERWGGWYVTGTHGQQQHMGNTLFTEPVAVEKLDLAAGANVTDLQNRADLKPYLTPHSDIVALMVLEHQTVMHNRLTAANYQARRALVEQEVLNKMMSNPSGERSPGIQRRLERAGDEVLECLLFAGEAPLTERIAGASGFAEYFAGLGPRDKQGRSLRDFDLQTRLFKYPCSYLIYSDAFAALPDPVKRHVYCRLRTILTGQATDSGFAHLTAEDREAICSILLETHADLSASWKSQ